MPVFDILMIVVALIAMFWVLAKWMQILYHSYGGDTYYEVYRSTRPFWMVWQWPGHRLPITMKQALVLRRHPRGMSWVNQHYRIIGFSSPSSRRPR